MRYFGDFEIFETAISFWQLKENKNKINLAVFTALPFTM